MMKPTATLTNIARGGIVDDAALAQALREKKIAAAGLDLPADVIEGLVAETVEHARQVHGEGLALARLADAPLLELPRLIDGVDLGSLYELAESLRTQGVGLVAAAR